MKYYFQKHDENCYPLQYHLDYMKENSLKEMEVFEAKRESGTGYFFCKDMQSVGESGGCGKWCYKYKPRNGKKGICKHHGFTYEQCKSKILNLK